MKRNVFSPHGDLYLNRFSSSVPYDMPVQHYHDSYEICFMLDGERYMFCDNTRYKLQRGSVVLIKPYDIHCSESRELKFYDRYVLNFTMRALSDMLSAVEAEELESRLHTSVFTLSGPDMEILREFFKRAEKYKPLASDGFVPRLMFRLTMLQIVLFVMEKSEEGGLTPTKSIPDFVSAAIEYINSSYRDIASISDIAAAINVSLSHLCHTFTKYTGETMLGYLNYVRLSKAHSLLIGTNESMDAIAVETGFKTAINFTRTFKKEYGMAPSHFRRKAREEAGK